MPELHHLALKGKNIVLGPVQDREATGTTFTYQNHFRIASLHVLIESLKARNHVMMAMVVNGNNMPTYELRLGQTWHQLNPTLLQGNVTLGDWQALKARIKAKHAQVRCRANSLGTLQPKPQQSKASRTRGHFFGWEAPMHSLQASGL